MRAGGQRASGGPPAADHLGLAEGVGSAAKEIWDDAEMGGSCADGSADGIAEGASEAERDGGCGLAGEARQPI